LRTTMKEGWGRKQVFLSPASLFFSSIPSSKLQANNSPRDSNSDVSEAKTLALAMLWGT
jgi:hypothetical protein